MPRTRSPQIRYGVHPSVPYAARIVENLPARTGRSLEDWVSLLGEAGASDNKERRSWLRDQHGLGGTTIGLILNHAAGKGAENLSPEAYLANAPKLVEAMYAGPKARLLPIYEALLELGVSLGPDVRACPCKTIVPLYRTHVFAEIKPTTRTRIDLGLALKGHEDPIPQSVLDTGGLARGDRITHRIPLASLDEITKEVGDWLAHAYALDPPPNGDA